jgi:hypothetical protein
VLLHPRDKFSERFLARHGGILREPHGPGNAELQQLFHRVEHLEPLQSQPVAFSQRIRVLFRLDDDRHRWVIRTEEGRRRASADGAGFQRVSSGFPPLTLRLRTPNFLP